MEEPSTPTRRTAADIVESLPPNTWDVAVWLTGSNYITGRIDAADVKRIVETVSGLASAANPVNAPADVVEHIAEYVNGYMSSDEMGDHPEWQMDACRKFAAGFTEELGLLAVSSPEREAVEVRLDVMERQELSDLRERCRAVTDHELAVLERLRRVHVTGDMGVNIPTAEDPRDRFIGFARNLMWWLHDGRPPAAVDGDRAERPNRAVGGV